jgi:hypothetical protein
MLIKQEFNCRICSSVKADIVSEQLKGDFCLYRDSILFGHDPALPCLPVRTSAPDYCFFVSYQNANTVLQPDVSTTLEQSRYS